MTDMSSICPEGFEIGQVKWYDADKKYGFIRPFSGGDDVFVYASDIRPKYIINTHHDPSVHMNNAKLISGEYVVFQRHEADARTGKTKATNVSGPYDQDGPGTLICDYGVVKFDTYSRRQFNHTEIQPPFLSRR